MTRTKATRKTQSGGGSGTRAPSGGRTGPKRRRGAPRRLATSARSSRSTPRCTATVRIEETARRATDRAAQTIRVRVQIDPDTTAGATWSSSEQGRLSTVLAAAGHTARLTMLRLLLTGPATYQAVRRATKLKPGPLYHHINQLRLAGLILPKQRDLYELTRAGRNLVLVSMAIPKLVTDRRRRPM